MEKEKYKEELNNGYTKVFPNAEERRFVWGGAQ